MSGALAFFLLVFSRTVFAQAVDPGRPFAGFGVSLGRSPRVVAPLTYDRKKAAAGGCIYAVLRAEVEDTEAIRMSQALVLASGGLFSRGAVVAREHGVPAVVLSQGRWDGGGIVIDEPVYGAARASANFRFFPVERTAERRISEGEIVGVDSEAGSLILFPPERRQEEFDLAQALGAYDGLRDAQALIQWWQARADSGSAVELAERLVAELSRRAGEGRARAEDPVKFLRAAAVRLPRSGQPLESELSRSVAAAAREGAARIDEERQSLVEAASAKAVDRILSRAEARWKAIDALTKAAGMPGASRPAEAAWTRARKTAQSRRIASTDGGWRAAAQAAGARAVESKTLGADVYRGFIAQAGIGPAIAEISDDASLPLSLKSERIAALFSAAKIPDDSETARAIAGAAAGRGPWDLASADGERRVVPSTGVAQALKDVWAASWSPEALGARKRAGVALVSPQVRVSPDPEPDVSGAAFSRDPASGLADRVVVDAVPGRAEGLEELAAASDQYLLDRRSGRELLPALIAGKEQILSASQLERVARVARALDDYFGAGVELEFSFRGGELTVASVKPMARMVDAGGDPFALTP